MNFLRRVNVRTLAGGAAFAGALALTPLPAAAAHEDSYTADVRQLNGSGTVGQASVSFVDANTVTVRLLTTGASPNLPHAQHIHVGNMNQCPDADADENNDGFITIAEGAPYYGSIALSLTTSGDVSAASGLAVDRFPVADANGVVDYQRTFDLPEGVTAGEVVMGSVVQHGISELFDDTTMYDGEPRSSIAPTVPLEITIPAACGEIVKVDKTAAPLGAAAELSDDVDAAASAFAADFAIATSSVDEAAAYGAFEDKANAIFANHEAELMAAMERFEAQIAAGENKYVARDNLINAYQRANAEALNKLQEAKNMFIDSLNRSGVAKDEFVNQFDRATAMLGNQLEVAKNNFSENINNS